MIAGETEHIIRQAHVTYPYDELFGLGGKRRRSATGTGSKHSPEARAARKEKRRQFWSGVGNTVKESGGLEGVTHSLSNVFNLFKKQSAPAAPADYQVGLRKAPPVEQNHRPTSAYVIGGAVVIGLVLWGVTAAQKSKKRNAQSDSR